MTNKELSFSSKDFQGNVFTYRDDSGKSFIKSRDMPSKLYKYYGINCYTVDAFCSKDEPYFYFSHPHEFNDIVDSSVLLWDMDLFPEEDFNILFSSLPKSDEYEVDKSNGFPVLHHLLNQKFIPDTIYEERCWTFIVYHHERFIRLSNYLFAKFSEKWGVLCLTESYASNLMWAHYTSEKGFCVEYKSTELVTFLANSADYSIKHFPINYQSVLKRLPFQDYMYKTSGQTGYNYNVNIPLLYLFSVKDSQWSYENEWRFLVQKEGLGYATNKLDYNSISTSNVETRKIEIKSELISRIVLGPHFFNASDFDNYDKNGDVESYSIKSDSKNLSILHDLISSFKNKFNDRLCQIEHYVTTDSTLMRDITHQVSILSFENNRVKIKRSLLQNF